MLAAMPFRSSVGWLGWRRVDEAAGESDGGAEARHHAAFAGGADEVLQAHELGDGGGHLGRDAGRQRRQRFGGGVLGEQPVAELAHGEVRDGGEGGGVVRVADQTGDLVGFVGDKRLGQEGFQRHIGQGHLGADTLFGGGRGDPGQAIARARGRGFGKQGSQVHTEGSSPRWAKAEASSGASTRRLRACTA